MNLTAAFFLSILGLIGLACVVFGHGLEPDDGRVLTVVSGIGIIVFVIWALTT